MGRKAVTRVKASSGRVNSISFNQIIISRGRVVTIGGGGLGIFSMGIYRENSFKVFFSQNQSARQAVTCVEAFSCSVVLSLFKFYIEKKPTIKLLFKTQMFQYVVLLYTWKHIDILLIPSCLDCCTWTMVGLHQVIKGLCRFIDIWKPRNTTINTQYVIWLWKSFSYKKGLMFNMRISGLRLVNLFI